MRHFAPRAPRPYRTERDWLYEPLDNPRQGVVEHHEFMPSTAAVQGFNATGSGGATQETTGSGTHPGIGIIYTSGSASGWYSFYRGTTTMNFGEGRMGLEFLFQIPTLGTAAQEFQFDIGFHDSTTSAGPVDGAFVRYLRTLNSGAFTFYTSNNSVTTSTSSTLAAVAGTYYVGRVMSNERGTAVDFTVKPAGTNVPYVAQHTANIPTSRQFSFGAFILTSAGTGTHQCWIDYMRFKTEFLTPR